MQAMLTKSQILSRLQNAQGNPWDEVFKILNVPSNVYEPTEQETEQPAHAQTYKVNFVSRRKDTAQINLGFANTKKTNDKPRSFFDSIDNWAKDQGASGLAYI